MSFKVELDAKDLIKELKNLEKELAESADKDVKDTALELEGNAKQDCPVDTGRLRASIQTENVGDLEYEVGTDVEYAKYVHDGTRKKAPKPFLIGKNTELALNNLIKRLNRTIEKVVG